MKIRDVQFMSIFVLSNIVLLLVAWAVLFQPVRASLDNVRIVTMMQENRLEIYRRQTASVLKGDEYLTTAVDDADGFFKQRLVIPFHHIADVLDYISYNTAAMDLREIIFASSEPVGYGLDTGVERTVFDVRVMAVYEGGQDAVEQFLHFLDSGFVRVREMHMEWMADEVALRLGFSMPALR